MRLNAKTVKALRRSIPQEAEVDYEPKKTHMVRVFVPGLREEDFKQLGRVIPLKGLDDEYAGYMYPVTDTVLVAGDHPRRAYLTLKKIARRCLNKAALIRLLRDEPVGYHHLPLKEAA